MKWSLDTQINAFFQWHLENEMASFFLLWSSFFSATRPLANSDETAYYRPASGRTDGIPESDQRPRIMDTCKSVFTNSWLVCSRNGSSIKGLGKNQQKGWTRSLFAVPSVRGHQTVTPWTPRNDCVYTSQAPRAACWQVSRPHTQKSECVFKSPPIING